MVRSDERIATREYLDEVKRLVDSLEHQIDPFVETLYEAYAADRTVFIAGNGGSAANASHFALDLSRGTRSGSPEIRRLRAVSLTDHTPFLTAAANDDGYETVFADQLQSWARPGDAFVSVSCSGNSPNVLRALEYARSSQIRTIAITAFGGGRASTLVDVEVRVACEDFGMAEAVHSVLFHVVTAQLKMLLAGKDA